MRGDAAWLFLVRRPTAPGRGESRPVEAAPMFAHADRLEAAEAQVDAVAPGPDPDPGPNPAEAPRKKRGGGPKTEAGKQSSRWNADQHRMRAKVLMPADMAAPVAERQDDLLQEFGPESPYEEW